MVRLDEGAVGHEPAEAVGRLLEQAATLFQTVVELLLQNRRSLRLLLQQRCLRARRLELLAQRLDGAGCRPFRRDVPFDLRPQLGITVGDHALEPRSFGGVLCRNPFQCGEGYAEMVE
jgi:hypothetical protein